MVDADPRFPDADETLVLEPDCARCPALVDCRNRISWGVGPDDATVMVVGEAPGAGNPDADRWRGGNWTGMSYTARHSGRRIRETMAAVGYESGVFYTNAVKCFPSDGEGSNRAPTAAEKANCRDHLVSELEAVDPDVVVPTGRHATESVLALDDASLDGFLDTVLDPVESERFGYTVVPLLHPSYRDVWLSRLGYELDEYLADLEALLPER
ncbi:MULTISPECIES: uracil-DNA glycosylase [Haloferax]|jgi:uracil-DNA glycosylase family 4|uniref:Uracil DNA glycosylase n=4 Tax=Haloferax TaxID=2251 RepID=M0I1E1_HALVO|nr:MULTISPECIES: uracil-DNA glycosylase family protein [Haloferax]ELZ90630.1 uracil DNA glycosylase [Haloferax alexandrinus JCM 10717]MBC9985051.1 uracil-DNA glycosylase [Haloferax sp. AS1]RDZ30186.1 uracil-DNA glycosylase [Haloferax sp. Atlit-48N]RDZ36798.1 uracil-DNA glycosylase [Haloferax sp. Atlit-24N]RDZ41710.1 uracil-DNA glycosylase [Haloferax sp. Atlit-47N]